MSSQHLVQRSAAIVQVERFERNLYKSGRLRTVQFNCNNRYMLTDIFAYRYADRPIWNDFREADRILLVQGFRMVSEHLFPAGADGKLDVPTKNAWDRIHSKLTMELGLESLAPLNWNFYDSNKVHRYGNYSVDFVCKTWLLADFKQGQDADEFMKTRISFLELAFRERMNVLSIADAIQRFQAQSLTKKEDAGSNRLIDVMQSLGDAKNALNQMQERKNAQTNAAFVASCQELNERFRRAKVALNYHNGFIQIETDEMVQSQIAEPFWKLVSDPKWKNVETDMMEAVDRSESAQRDPAFYAAKALESAIKIISDERGWTTGKEGGAGQYIDNFRKRANGSFVAEWEAAAIRHIFTNVRNELGHGPGGEPMPALTQQQTDWTIEAAMSWTKSLIGRL